MKLIWQSIFILLIMTFFSCSNKDKWINSNIEGNLLQECPSVKDDFYQSVNYDRLKNESLTSYTNSNAERTNQIIENQMLEILTKEKSDDRDEQLLIDLYNMYLDDEKRNADGIKPILPVVKKIQAIKSLKDFETAFSDEDVKWSFPITIRFVSTDIVFSSPYFLINLYFKEFPKEMMEMYIKMFVKLGYDESEAKRLLLSACDFEKNYHEAQIDNSVSIISLSVALEKYLNLPLEEYIKNTGLLEINRYVFDESRFRILDSLFIEENLENIKTLCILTLLSKSKECLDEEFEKLVFDCKNKIKGTSISFSTKTKGINFLKTNFPDLFSKVWIKNYFSEEIKKDVEKIAYEILEEYKNQINSWDWMSGGTKYNSVAFLNQMKVFVGYYKFNDYSNYNLGKNLYESYFESLKHIREIQEKKCYETNDIYEWQVFPYEYNAYYNSSNSINFCAGYIYGNGYRFDMSTEEKYAAVGITIAHEISHCLSFGNLMQIFDRNDYKALEERLLVFADYYSTFEILDGINCNGTFCKSEIGADLFAMQAILEIVKNIPNFDYKLFFESYAKNNFSKTTENVISLNHQNDTHPPLYLRVNVTVQQFDEFYKTFNIKRKDGMFLKKEDRIEF